MIDQPPIFSGRHWYFFFISSGNKSRNQQIRADLPQAKQIQDQEIKGAQRQIKDYRFLVVVAFRSSWHSIL